MVTFGIRYKYGKLAWYVLLLGLAVVLLLGPAAVLLLGPAVVLLLGLAAGVFILLLGWLCIRLNV
jgi:hypothetical protein